MPDFEVDARCCTCTFLPDAATFSTSLYPRFNSAPCCQYSPSSSEAPAVDYPLTPLQSVCHNAVEAAGGQTSGSLDRFSILVSLMATIL